jgi:cell division septum initiation protein DivIVA
MSENDLNKLFFYEGKVEQLLVEKERLLLKISELENKVKNLESQLSSYQGRY